MLRSVAVSCHCFVEMFAFFKVSLSESFQRRSERPTVLVPVVSSPNNNCFGIRSSEGWEERGRKGRGGAGVREGRRGGRGGRRGMTVIHILMAPQYLNNNHVTYYVIT